MASLGMQGPYRLTPEMVDKVIPRRHPGNFAVGYCKDPSDFVARHSEDSHGFVVRYVGRADSDLNQTLKEQETDSSTWFKWSYAPSEKVAFDKQCKNYHDFGENAQLENEEHPAPPKGTRWKCPVCGA